MKILHFELVTFFFLKNWLMLNRSVPYCTDTITASSAVLKDLIKIGNLDKKTDKNLQKQHSRVITKKFYNFGQILLIFSGIDPLMGKSFAESLKTIGW